MKSNKGQGMIGEVLIGATAIVIAITIFLILEGTNRGVQEEKISEEVDLSIGKIHKNTVVSNTLNDNISKVETVEHNYDNLTAGRLISYYFSTPGDKVYTDEKSEAIEKEEVKEDIKAYLTHKMDYYFGGEVDYYLDIQNFNEVEDRPKKITVKNTENTGEADVRTAIYLSNGDKIHLNLFTKGARNIFH
jgi:hypothetical protein